MSWHNVGAPGPEIRGPYKDKEYILATILQAAKDAGVALARCGARVYATSTLESGWIAGPLPGIYTGDGILADYRDWLGSATSRPRGLLAGLSFPTGLRIIT